MNQKKSSLVHHPPQKTFDRKLNALVNAHDQSPSLTDSMIVSTIVFDHSRSLRVASVLMPLISLSTACPSGVSEGSSLSDVMSALASSLSLSV